MTGMKKIIGSKWFAAAVGVVLFLVTILIFSSSQPAEQSKATDAKTNNAPDKIASESAKHDPLEESKPIVNLASQAAPLAGQVGEPGSLAFHNPEVNKLIAELRQERVALHAREKDLKELAKRLVLEKTEIGTITQEVVKFKIAVEHALTNGLTTIRQEEEKKLQQLASIYTNMPPGNAVAILDNMPAEDIAKIMAFMKEREKASILENFATNTAISNKARASEISERIRRTVPEIQMPALRK
jgi:flagellar motility protein MotE (MotC chaperone)